MNTYLCYNSDSFVQLRWIRIQKIFSYSFIARHCHVRSYCLLFLLLFQLYNQIQGGPRLAHILGPDKKIVLSEIASLEDCVTTLCRSHCSEESIQCIVDQNFLVPKPKSHWSKFHVRRNCVGWGVSVVPTHLVPSVLNFET